MKFGAFRRKKWRQEHIFWASTRKNPCNERHRVESLLAELAALRSSASEACSHDGSRNIERIIRSAMLTFFPIK